MGILVVQLCVQQPVYRQRHIADYEMCIDALWQPVIDGLAGIICFQDPEMVFNRFFFFDDFFIMLYAVCSKFSFIQVLNSRSSYSCVVEYNLMQYNKIIYGNDTNDFF